MTLAPVESALIAGFVIGLLFGVTAQASGFCLMSALRGWWTAGDGVKVRSFALAVAVALIGSQVLVAAGWVDLNRTLYVQQAAAAPMAVVGFGGLLFGYGMVMANGCGARALVLLGGGNLRSLVVLVALAVAAQMTQTGLLAPLRLWLAELPGTLAGIASAPLLLAGAGLAGPAARGVAVIVAATALLVFVFAHRPLRAARGQIAGGAVIGALVPAGWLATGVLGADEFEPAPLVSLTFIAPVADSLQYLMLSTGTRLEFGVAVIAGVLSGALITALARGGFELRGFSSPRSMLRYIAGGACMGMGGVLAFGCSIGQGLTGLSTLALASFVAAAGILAGTALGLRGPLRLAPVTP